MRVNITVQSSQSEGLNAHVVNYFVFAVDSIRTANRDSLVLVVVVVVL